jgi:hypothetical protein
VNDAQRGEMARLCDQGLTMAEIGRRLGLAQQTVGAALRRMGYKDPPGVKRPRGFAGMDPERKRAIQGQGGKAAHAQGTAHEWTPEEARAAGAKGGRESHRRGRAHRFTSAKARAASKKGVAARRRKKAGRA